MPDLPFRRVVPLVGADRPQITWAERFLAKHNEERAAVGLPAYVLDSRLTEVAQLRVNDMAEEQYFGHDDPNHDPGKYWEILQGMGLSYTWAGENLALNNFVDPLAEAWRGLMASPTHRANILDTTYTAMGAAAQIQGAALFVFACVYASGLSPQ